MVLKDGVKLNGVKSVIVTAMLIVDSVYAKYGKELVVTSVMDGKHMVGSKHYDGEAFDCRIWYFETHELESVRKDIVEALSDEFDVVLEKTHYHIEFDPK